MIPFLLIIMSYARIVSSILKVPSARGIRKAFSTCGPHLSMVSLFYGTIIGLYLYPSTNNSTVKETVMAVMYTVVTPMLNPFIYSLRNRDMKRALGRVFWKKKIFLSKTVTIGIFTLYNSVVMVMLPVEYYSKSVAFFFQF